MSDNDNSPNKNQEKPWLSYYGDQVPEHMKFEPTTVVGMLRQAVKRFPDHIAVNDQGHSVTYALLLNMIDTFSCSLKKFGIKKGDCVGIMLNNTISLVTAYYATLKIGGVAVLIDPDCHKNDLEYILNHAGIKVVVSLDKRANELISIRKKSSLERVIYTTSVDHRSIPKNKFFQIFRSKKHQSSKVTPARDLYAWKDLLAERPLIVGEEAIGLNDLAMVLYARHSNGKLNGVVLSHDNLSCQVQQISTWFTGFNPGLERTMTAASLFKSFGVTMAMNWPLANGWEMALTSRDNPEQLSKTLTKSKPGLMMIEPGVMVKCVNEGVRKSDFSSIRGCFLGTEFIDTGSMTSFEDKTGVRVVPCFGIPETTAITHIHPISSKPSKAGSIGIPISDTECRIIDPNDPDNITVSDKPGEMLIRGPQAMRGYLEQKLDSQPLLDGIWLKTGVMVTMDDDGFFYVVDTPKNSAAFKNDTIESHDIDHLVDHHPKVLRACVVNKSQTTSGEGVKLFVVLKKGTSASPDEFIEFCKQRMSPEKCPTHVEIIDELPDIKSF